MHLLVRRPSAPGTGDTLFLSMVEAYASLPPANRSRIANLWALHDDKDGRQAVHPVVRKVGEQAALFVNGHFTRCGNNQAFHRFSVRFYCRSGPTITTGASSALVASPAGNAAAAATAAASGGGQSELDSAEAAEHAELLDGLKAHIEAMKPLRVKWSREDVVMWDERTTQHAAVHDYFGQYRELHRVLVSGDVPVRV